MREKPPETSSIVKSDSDENDNKGVTLSYPPHLAPSKEFRDRIEQQIIKEEFISGRNRRVGKSIYEDSEFPFGVTRILWVDFPHSNYNEYQNTYIFNDKTEKIFYIRGNQSEKVKINDMEIFKKLFQEIMVNEGRIYTLKELTNEQIHALITSNGGHAPKLPNNPILRPGLFGSNLQKNINKEALSEIPLAKNNSNRDSGGVEQSDYSDCPPRGKGPI